MCNSKIRHDLTRISLEETKTSRSEWFLQGSTIVCALTLGALAIAYFCNPSFKSSINHFIAPLHNQIALSRSLFLIGVPVGGAVLTFGFLIHFGRLYYKRSQYDKEFLDRWRHFKQSVEEMLPTQRQLMISALVCAILVVSLWLTALILTNHPSANFWIHQTGLPAIQKGLAMKLPLWKAILFIGSVTGLSSSLLAHLAFKKHP
jgi:uncharacterized membrane protein required for colicin V production